MGQPIKKTRYGKVEAAIWEDDYNGQKSYSTTFQKSYKAKDGSWKQSSSFSATDMRDLYVLVGALLNRGVKDVTLQSKQADNPAKEVFPDSEEVFPDEIPF